MNKNIIQRFLDNSCSEREKQEVFQWLVSQESEHEANAMLKKHWEAVAKDQTEVRADFDGIYDRMLDEIEEEKVIELLKKPKSNETKTYVLMPSILKYAAIILLAIGVGFAVWFQNQTLSNSTQVALIEKVTSRGQKTQLMLSDGSKVHMNAESHLIYDEGFGKTNRDVKLVGEAYFEVAKNEELPFNVTANNTITTALGTAFNISAYEESTVTAISLTEGKVSIKPAHAHIDELEPVILSPGQEFQVGLDPSAGLVRAFDEDLVVSWKNNVLLFDNTNMTEMIANLERWYNVKVIVLEPSKMSGVRASGKFENESLQNVLRVLSYSLQFDYQVKNDTVTINFN